MGQVIKYAHRDAVTQGLCDSCREVIHRTSLRRRRARFCSRTCKMSWHNSRRPSTIDHAKHMLQTQRPASEEELAYLAGLIDGEGCISIVRYNRGGVWSVASAFLRIGMTDRLGVQLAHDIFGGNLRLAKRTGAMACYKPMWTWTVGGRRAAFAVDCVLPYLRVKRAQAGLLLQYQRTVPIRGTRNHRGRKGAGRLSDQELHERQWFFERMKRLNKRAKEIASCS